MRLRRDTIRVEESALFPGRLSLHRLPAKCGCALCHLGSRAPRRFGRIRSFAACCGTHLFIEDTTDSEMVDVTIASLDDPTPFAPRRAIWLEDRLPWVTIDESLPKFPEDEG